MFFAKIVNNCTNHNFHAEIYSNGGNDKYDSRENTKLFRYHREYGCFTVTFQ